MKKIQKSLSDIGKRYYAWESVDKDVFQRTARILQSIWREEQGYDIGENKGRGVTRPLGSRLAMPWAKETLANFLTDGVKKVVRKEVLDPDRSRNKLFGQPRIFNDLLSSQPLCFNLFGELALDIEFAAEVFMNLTSGHVARVERIEFEHSPGRGDVRYTADNSAFDVYVEYVSQDEKNGFLGIEVKYHEDLRGTASAHKVRYEEVASEMGCFHDEAITKLKKAPLQQIWRDHLLAGALKMEGGFDHGQFVFLYPKNNAACSRGVAAYRKCLVNDDTFIVWTLEEMVAAIRQSRDTAWVDAFHDRYLAFDKVRP